MVFFHGKKPEQYNNNNNKKKHFSWQRVNFFSFSFLFFEKMSTENVSSSSPSCPPVFGRKQGGQRRGKTYVFKLVVLKSTKTFLPKLTFAKEILILPVKPLRVQESTTACQNKKKKEKKSLFINFPPQSYCKVAVKTQPFLDEEPGSLQMQITQPER